LLQEGLNYSQPQKFFHLYTDDIDAWPFFYIFQIDFFVFSLLIFPVMFLVPGSTGGRALTFFRMTGRDFLVIEGMPGLFYFFM